MTVASASRISAKGQVTVPKRVREALGARPGDVLAYEVRGNVVILRRVDPFDAAFHAALTQTVDEWASPEDDEAFREL
jgi:AbrB family looped-hinge helix DNA binding protein